MGLESSKLRIIIFIVIIATIILLGSLAVVFFDNRRTTASATFAPVAKDNIPPSPIITASKLTTPLNFIASDESNNSLIHPPAIISLHSHIIPDLKSPSILVTLIIVIAVLAIFVSSGNSAEAVVAKNPPFNTLTSVINFMSSYLRIFISASFIVVAFCILYFTFGFTLAQQYQSYPNFSLLKYNIASLLRKEATCPGNSTNPVSDEKSVRQEKSRINRRHIIILDAGSQGTRMNIYELEFCDDLLTAVHKDLLFSVSIPLSSLAETADSFTIGTMIIDPLLSEALQLIPSNEHSCTPVALRATAGLRLLSPKQINRLLIGTKKAFSKYPFMLIDNTFIKNQSSAELISGTSEGIGAWIAINFLYENWNKDCLCTKCIIGSEITTSNSTFNSTPKKSVGGSVHKTNSVADLGGASLQIIAEISEEEAQIISKVNAYLIKSNPERQVPDVVHSVNFQGKFYILFVHSFLGYGFKTIQSAIALSAINNQLGTNFCNISTCQNSSEMIIGKAPSAVIHPCIPENVEYHKLNTFIASASGSTSAYITIKGSAKISWNKCCASVASIFDLNTCEYPQCSFNNIPFPQSVFKKKNEIISLSSYFSVVLGPLLPLLAKYGSECGSHFSFERAFLRKKASSIRNDPLDHMHKDISLNDIERFGKMACSLSFTSEKYPDIFAAYSKISHSSLVEGLCLDLSYIYVLMTQGFKVPKEGPGSILRVEKESIGNVFPCWSLSAAMELFNIVNNL